MSKQQEMYYKAKQVVNVCIIKEADYLLEKILSAALEDEVQRRKYREQQEFEGLLMIADDAVSWLGENIFDEFWSIDIPAMMTVMLSIPEMRKAMENYAGLVQYGVKKALLINFDRKNEAKKLFDDLFGSNSSSEAQSPPTSMNEKAVIHIQTIARGFMGRKRARKVFVTVFVKRYDSSFGACYYVNLNTGQSSWCRPLIYPKLFPKGSW